jgi:hypothetical protein
MNFSGQVVPELQRRGLTRGEYRSGTLRDRLGLPRPANQFSSVRCTYAPSPDVREQQRSA